MSRFALLGVVCALTVGGVACSTSRATTARLVAQAGSSADGSSITLALPRSTGPQNLLVAAVSWDGDGGLVVSGGARSWAATGPSSALGSATDGAHAQLIYGIADSGPEVTVSAAQSTHIRVDLREYSGVDGADPFLAGTGSVSPPRSDRRGDGLTVTAVATPDRPADIHGRDVALSSAPDPLVSAPGDGGRAFTATFRVGPSVPVMRDPLRQPFASTSIWNTAIGSAAEFTPAGLPAVPGGDRFAPMPQNDETSILQTPTAPMTELRYSGAGWTGRSRCTATGSRTFYRVPMPADYVVASSTHNEGASWLMPDGRTIDESGPLARCERGGYATSIDTSEPLDLYGDGLSRSLGGSGLSGLVGALRLGELRPGTDGTGVRHALRVNIDTDRQLASCTTDSSCFRWPASSADSDATRAYGSRARDVPSAMRLGALLAIAPSVDIGSLGLRTAPGRQIAWTLQNYGAYVADSAACACFAIVTEKGPDGDFASQFADDYGFDFAQRVDDGTAWTRDLQKLQTVLSVVDDNGPLRIGGGGLPRQPAAAAISP